MSEEYDLKKSQKIVGQLYPILAAKDGETIDGFHREESDPNWKRITLEHIDTEEKKLIARLIANKFRRQITADEVQKYINQLAEIYLNQEIEPGRISGVVAENTGYSERHVRSYLDDKYKLMKFDSSKSKVEAVSTSEPSPFAVAEQRIKEMREELGDEFTGKFLEHAVTDSDTFDRIMGDIHDEKVSKELFEEDVELKSKGAKSVIPEIRITPKAEVEQYRKELKKIQTSPETQRRFARNKNWLAHGNVVSMAISLRCPKCGKGIDQLVWKCCDLAVKEAHQILRDEE